MEGDKKGCSYKVLWIFNIIRHGLFLHGVRNNLAKLGLDFMPYYWCKTTMISNTPPSIKNKDLRFKFCVFGKSEINYIKSIIIGIEEKDFLKDLKNDEICVGLKSKDEIIAYQFIRRKSFYFKKRYFSLTENDGYLHSMYVFEKYRGNNIASFLRYQSFSLLEKEGVQNYYSICEYFNKSAFKYQRKLNSKPVKLYLSVVLFKKWTMNFKLKQY